MSKNSILHKPVGLLLIDFDQLWLQPQGIPHLRGDI